MPENKFRPGTLVQPKDRLTDEQIRSLHRASIEILDDPGILCFNEEAVNLLGNAGCPVRPAAHGRGWTIRIPESRVLAALECAPGQVVLGARDPANRLFLDAEVPRVYFGTGAEANFYLRSGLADFARVDDGGEQRRQVVFEAERGTLRHLDESARLCNALPNVDFFIRNVNLQDQEISEANKDVNVFFTSLRSMTKHVQAGLVSLEALDDVIQLGQLVAGGLEAFRDNPVLSFITCLVKSPLQMVDDTTAKLLAIVRAGVPVVVSSSPQGGSTAPIREEGIVALINAEILAGITLAQTANPGAPVLYGAVPVRARLDDLHDLYGAPEFIHYNVDCAQLARHYGLPCYSTAGVGDARVPGVQSTVEKLFAYLGVAQSGAQYVHYAFGLLDKTNVFSPLQAVLDDAHVGLVRDILRPASFGDEAAAATVREVRKVMGSSTRLFARFIRGAMREGLVSQPYPFESQSDSRDEVLERAQARLDALLAEPPAALPSEVVEQIVEEVPGVLPAVPSMQP